ncbi:amidohydrolase [Haloferula sp.]|uniref:amidohydrolase n=1 Tax=Haloferula sp. TaxID=2497595 RepID=UPI00329E3890
MGIVTAGLMFLATVGAEDGGSELTVFVAKKIITMEPALSEATAVAVADRRIVSVGSVESLQGWMKERGAKVDKTFEDKILMPGFIDAHVHPSLPAVLTQFAFLAPDDWSLPTGEFPGALTHDDYIAKLKDLVAKHDDPEVPFVAWGYHQLWHGEIFRHQLDELFPDTPVILWHRSFHEVIVNSAALKLIGMTEEEARGNHEIDWEKGHFWELGAKALMPKLSFIFAPDRYGKGMENFLEMMHIGGVTTALDMGTGIFGDAEGEIALIRKTAEGTEAPSRIVLTPIITDFLARKVSITQAMAEIDEWREGNSRRVKIERHFKIMMDGAIFSGLSQMGSPGYMDGHDGLWLAPVETSGEWARAFWKEGYKIHAHTNGDKSTDAMIEILKSCLDEKPRWDHRFTLEHFAYTTEDQNKKLKALGAVVSANPYYQYLLSDIYAENWLGQDRARQMVRLGSLERLEVPFALHSDCPMGPLDPLMLAWTAANRVTINGNQNAEPEKVSMDAALRAITIDAAWVMGWEDRVGSIRAGKMADFTVLDQDPHEVGVKGLKDIPVWGVVFEGEKHPVEGSKRETKTSSLNAEAGRAFLARHEPVDPGSMYDPLSPRAIESAQFIAGRSHHPRRNGPGCNCGLAGMLRLAYQAAALEER